MQKEQSTYFNSMHESSWNMHACLAMCLNEDISDKKVKDTKIGLW